MDNPIEIFPILDILFSSSSDSFDEDEDKEIMIIMNQVLVEVDQNNVRRRIPRVENYVENIVARYTDREFQSHYRLNRNTFDYVLFLIRPHVEGGLYDFGNRPIDPEKQLLIALYVLGTPDLYRSIVTKFNVGNATAWRAANRIVRALCTFCSYFIRWSDRQQALETAARIERRRGLPGVIGAVDGTQWHINKPAVDSRFYINRKGVYAIQSQLVCNDRLEFIHVFTGFPGSVHELRVFNNSGLQHKCNEKHLPEDTYMVGDLAYTCQDRVIVPYRNNGHLTVEEIFLVAFFLECVS